MCVGVFTNEGEENPSLSGTAVFDFMWVKPGAVLGQFLAEQDPSRYVRVVDDRDAIEPDAQDDRRDGMARLVMGSRLGGRPSISA